jgi:hypothetical protein
MIFIFTKFVLAQLLLQEQQPNHRFFIIASNCGALANSAEVLAFLDFASFQVERSFSLLFNSSTLGGFTRYSECFFRVCLIRKVHQRHQISKKHFSFGQMESTSLLKSVEIVSVPLPIQKVVILDVLFELFSRHEIVIFPLTSFASRITRLLKYWNSKFRSSWFNKCLTMVSPILKVPKTRLIFLLCSLYYFIFCEDLKVAVIILVNKSSVISIL